MSLFTANLQENSIEPVEGSWKIDELELEKLIVSDGYVLNPDIFGEELFCIDRQISTRDNKRADILAVDTAGRGVIIELKRDEAAIGADTQALQYLASFSNFRGERFLTRFGKSFRNNVRHPGDDSVDLRTALDEFLDEEVSTNDLNRETRITLVGQSFDRALFSMGNWFADQGVGFRCIQYSPIDLDGTQLLHFSTEFQQEPASYHDFDFTKSMRKPGFYWHNIGREQDEWWEYLKEKEVLTAAFDNAPNDKGAETLSNYVKGDDVFAYASGYGAVGHGKIDAPNSYQLLTPGDEEDVLDGDHLHRLDVRWVSVADSLDDAISPSEFKNEFGIGHPRRTRQAIKSGSPKALASLMNSKFDD